MIDVRALGYVVGEATRVDAWRRYSGCCRCCWRGNS